MTTFFHLLQMVFAFAHIMSSLSIVPACPFVTPEPGSLLVSLSFCIYVTSATTCPALWSRSSGSPHLQLKSSLLIAGLFCVVNITSINNICVQVITIIRGSSTALCIVWSLQGPHDVGYSFAELSTSKPLRWSLQFGDAPLKRTSFIVYHQKKGWEEIGHCLESSIFKQDLDNPKQAAWTFRKGWLVALCG